MFKYYSEVTTMAFATNAEISSPTELITALTAALPQETHSRTHRTHRTL